MHQEHKDNAGAQFATDCCSTIIWQINPEGNLVFANQEYIHFFGVKGPIQDTNYLSFIHPDDVEAYKNKFHNAVKGQSYFHAIARARKHDGSWRWIETRANPYFSPTGEFLGHVGSSPDITEMYLAKERFKEADIRKDQFIAILAHELRNPISPICNIAEMIKRRYKDDAQLQEMANIIQRQTRQVIQLVSDLTEVSRIKNGKIRVDIKEVEMQGILDDAVNAVQRNLNKSNHKLHIGEYDRNIRLSVDPVHIVQVLANILDNAIKYTPENGNIWVEVTASGATAQIAVRDDGFGIEDKKIKSIFDMFSQISGTIDHSQKGLGIGLSLVKDLIEVNNGSVHAHSDGQGKGSVFTVTLPLATPYCSEAAAV